MALYILCFDNNAQVEQKDLQIVVAAGVANNALSGIRVFRKW